MRALVAAVLLFATALTNAFAQQWIEVGADAEAKFYIDVDSITLVDHTLRVIKRGIYSHSLTETFGGKRVMFKETRGLVELDCKLRVNRVTRIEMLDENGAIVWSSGDMPRRLWLSVKPNSHAEATLEVACAQFKGV